MEAKSAQRRTGQRSWAMGALVVIVLGGAGGAVALSQHGGTAKTSHIVPPIPAPAAPAKPVVLPTKDLAPGLTGTTPRDAVKRFLDAEIAGDYDTSLGLLVDAERAQAGAPAVWKAAHGELPHYLSYEFTPSPDGAAVATTVHYEPRLDETTGFTPGTAVVTWLTQAEGGGYRVSLTSSTVQAVLPSDGDAQAAAIEWVRARQQCEVKRQYVGNLLGQPDVAPRLCHTSGDFTASAPAPLASFVDPTVVTNGLGPGAERFTRVVTLTGPETLHVVVAPLGDSWVVVGVSQR